MKRNLIALFIGATSAACSNPNAPEPVNPAAEWARQHINEVCAVDAYGRGHLYPVNTVLPINVQLVPISYCNPAE